MLRVPSASSALAWIAVLASSSALVLGCRSKEAPTPTVVRDAPAPVDRAPDAKDPAGLAGLWRAQLDSPGGALGFGLSFELDAEGYAAAIHNGDERLPLSSVSLQGDELLLRMDGYDSQIEATLDGETMRGTWSKTSPAKTNPAKTNPAKTNPAGRASLPFSASKGEAPRLDCAPAVPKAKGASPATVAGAWDLTFSEDDGGSYVGRAQLEQAPGEALVRGTILTDTGDYRYLEGCYRDGSFGLSVFDGAHAFLFRAEVGPSESTTTMRGDFWSRDSYHATFEGAPIPPGAADRLADPWAALSLAKTSHDRRFRFAFADLDGAQLSNEDPRFEGKVVIIEIFGSWCPNCNDQAPILSRWYRQYNDAGLEVLGLAYEFTGDPTRDTKILRAYAERHRISYPLLLAGTSAKTDAAATLPDLDRVLAYPTTIFIGRDGKVREIYSGYFGPATGPRHKQMIAEHEQLLRELLAERPTVGSDPAPD